MCTNNSCFGGNIWWIIILVLLFGCGGILFILLATFAFHGWLWFKYKDA